jgi:TM2 domain-containing membrane protein YozV
VSTPKKPLSDDTVAMMQFQSQSRSVGMAYVMLLLLGFFGAQRFYMGKMRVGFLVLVCSLLGLQIYVTFVVTIVVSLIDLFTLPSQVRAHNEKLLTELGA